MTKRFNLGLGFKKWLKANNLTPANDTVFKFNKISPSAIDSYSRATTNEFYRDNTGKFVNATSNQIRYDHDFSGNPLGMRFDWVSTNKCTNVNWNMVDLTGLTKAGNATASLSISTHPVHGHPVILLDNTLGGSGSVAVTITGQTGNTNPHSMRSCARVLAGALTGTFISDQSGGVVKTATDSGITAIDTDGFLFNENFTPASSNRQIRLNCAIGCKAMFWLNQLEELNFCTFPLLVNGATATRTAAASYDNLSSIPTYNEAQGSMIVEAVFDAPDGVAEYIAQIAIGSSPNDAYALTRVSSGQIRPRTAIATVPYTNNDIHAPIRGKRFPMAIAWKNGETLSAAGPMTWQRDTYTGAPTGMTRLNIGGRGSVSPFSGWIQSITILDQYQNQNQLATWMFPDVRTYRGIPLFGQSNMHGRFRSDVTGQNGGEAAAVAQMDAYYTDSENWALRCAINGSAADKANDAASGYTNWWYDSATGEFGPTMAYAKSVMTAFGKSRLLPIGGWDQAASDAGDANLKSNTKIILDEIVSFIGVGTKMVICPIARRQDTHYDSYSLVKRQQRELVTENPSYIYEAPPQNNVTCISEPNAHLTNASYATITTNLFRKMMSVLGQSVSGAVDPPTFASASRVSLAVTVPVTFPSGITAITPTTGIKGFRAFDGDPDAGGTEIAVTTTYAASNFILTLESLPSGSLYLEFARGSIYTEYLAGGSANPIINLPVGNGTGTLGLAWNKIIVT
jgi:hypothetical protein